MDFYELVLCFAICFNSHVIALRWTSGPPDNGQVRGCQGRTVDLSWDFSKTAAETIDTVQWLYRPQNNITEGMLAGDLQDMFFLTSSAGRDRITFLPHAGLQISNLKSSDSGVYHVVVKAHNGHDYVSIHENVTLVVMDPPMTAGGALYVTQDYDAIKDPVTSEWAVKLRCGVFTHVGMPAVSPVWTTPNGQTLQSNRYDNGAFFLQLTLNEIETGDYSCKLDSTSPAVGCLPPTSQQSLSASHYLDADKVRLMLLDRKLQDLEEVNRNQTRLLQQQELQIQRLQHGCDTGNSASSIPGILGTTPHAGQHSNCLDWLRDGHTTSGSRVIFPDQMDGPLTVYCDQLTDQGGWTVIQRRQDGAVDFYRPWSDYQKGFGSPNAEFWIGLDNLYRLTSRGTMDLRVDLTSFDGTSAYALYTNFSVSNRGDNYRLGVHFSNGSAGDSLYVHNGQQFSTLDKDNDVSDASTPCAMERHGGWWYGDCGYSNLNGRYFQQRQLQDGAIYWLSFDGWFALKSVEMKIRPA